MDLTACRTLGHSGLAVSPLALGTMTFGAGRWGSDETTSRAIFDAYVDAGGNFLDTADVYSGGRSEEMLGAFVADRGLRNRLVIATKSGFPREQGTPLAGGNSALNIRAGIQGSLRRLRTDRIDMYWTHVWDRTTPAEEVLRALTDAVRRGDILYYGFSNAPAWYAARIATLAHAHGLPAPVGLQYAYSLLDRGVELDVVPAGNALGLGLVPWSPLAAGMLTGKYGRDMVARAGPAGSLPDRAGDAAQGGSDGRLNGDNPFGGPPLHRPQFRRRRRATGRRRRDRPADGAGGALLGGTPSRRSVGAHRREPTRAAGAEYRLARRHAGAGSAGAARRGGQAAVVQPLFHLRSAACAHLRRPRSRGLVRCQLAPQASARNSTVP